MFTGLAFYQDTAVAAAGLTYGRFVASRRVTGTLQRAAWSNDGINWTAATTPSSNDTFGVDFNPNDGLYVMSQINAATNNIISSTNGVTWTSRSKPNTTAVWGVSWCQSFGKWIMCGSRNVFTSTNGIDWITAYTYSGTLETQCTQPLNAKNGGTDYWMVPLAPPTPSGSKKYCYTTDGISFAEYDSQGNWWATGQSQMDTNVSTGLILDMGYPYDRVAFSYTASSGWSSWTYSVPIAGAARLQVCYTPTLKLWHIAPSSGGNYTQAIAYSSTGLEGSFTYSTFPSSTSYRTRDVVWSEELKILVIIGFVGTTGYYSTNGTTWTSHTTLSDLTNAVFGPGVRTTGYKQGAGIT